MHRSYAEASQRFAGGRERLTDVPKTTHWQWYVEQFAPTELHHHAVEETYFAGETPFQSIAVIRTAQFGKMLVLDGDTQSSQADEKIYHESLVHPALAAIDDRDDVLILGGGEGATLREVLRRRDVRRCTMVDIDGDVIELSKRYLAEWSDGAFEDPRARVIVGDALAFLRDDADTYGAIVSDLTEPLEDSPSNVLFNEAVFKNIKARLAPGGVYVLQASTAGFHNMSLHAKMARTLRRHYRFVRSFYAHVPAFDNDWAFLACSDAVDVAALAAARIDGYVAQLEGENYFYDSETHRRLFSLPLYLRRELAKEGDVFLSAPISNEVDAAIARWDKQKALFIKTLDLHLEDVGDGKAQMRMPFRSQVMNGAGAIHGGAIVSLCDTAFWVALASIYGPTQPTATASLTCSFLRPALPPHDLVAHATVLKPGKRIVYGEVHVYSGEKLVAHATLSFLNTSAADREPPVRTAHE